MHKIHLRAFTLIELSIVLVIIGLIVGGVLVGNDLIKAAKIRSTLAQIDQYKIMMRMFKDKYNHLAGDIPEPYATNFFGDRVCNPAAGSNWLQGGDGNGVITRNANNFPEFSMVWCQFSLAGFIQGNFVNTSPISVWATNLYVQLPMYNIGGNNNCGMSGNDSCFLISNCRNCGSDSGAGFSPIDARAIDMKVDDGLPFSGMSVRGVRSIYQGFSDPQNCTASWGSNAYQSVDFPSCALTFKIN